MSTSALFVEVHSNLPVTLKYHPSFLVYLRTLEEVTKRNTKDTIDLSRALSGSIKNFSLQLYRDEADMLDTQVAMGKQVRYSASIRETETAILEIEFSLTQLQESLDLRKWQVPQHWHFHTNKETVCMCIYHSCYKQSELPYA